MYWSQYRRTFIPVQAFIVVVCTLFACVGHLGPRGLLTPLVVMEAAAVFGARQAARVKMSLGLQQPMLKPLTDD